MRIISGCFKGRIFQAPKHFKLRPTTDLGKESLFNVLNNTWEFENLLILDLFAGIGSISFEFASRNSLHITSVESNIQHAEFIEKTANSLGIENLKVIKQDAFEFIKRCSFQYNIIFADPPYTLDGVAQIPDLIFSGNLLKPEGELILEHSDEHDFSEHPNFVQKRVYGAVNFSFFE